MERAPVVVDVPGLLRPPVLLGEHVPKALEGEGIFALPNAPRVEAAEHDAVAKAETRPVELLQLPQQRGEEHGLAAARGPRHRDLGHV